MFFLIVYLLLAIGFSFLCSIAEAVLLSITPSYLGLLDKSKATTNWLAEMKNDINKPLAAILSLNTIAHTVGAAGTGAEATKLFGDAYIGIISAILTFMILVFSEIIPKSIGARNWKSLAPMVGWGVHYLVIAMWPLVKLSEFLTKAISSSDIHYQGFSREEFALMADISKEEGQLAEQELLMIKSLLHSHNKPVFRILTPRTVVFSISAHMKVEEYIESHPSERFSRIPIYEESPENLVGFVLQRDLLDAMVKGKEGNLVSEFKRELPPIPDSLSVVQAFQKSLRENSHILQVIDEHGGLRGIVTLEDFVETILGMEIVDEGDKVKDMQKLAKRHWRLRKRFFRK